jgi:hypothetical protein
MNSFTNLKSFNDFLDRNNFMVSNQEKYNEIIVLNRNFKIDAILSDVDELSQHFEIELKDLSSIPYVIITDNESGQKFNFLLWKK